MKKTFLFLTLTGMAFLMFQAFTAELPEALSSGESAKDLLKTSCYDCHTDAAKSHKAKSALNFDRWDAYKDSKKVSRLAEICEVVEEDKMPPEKYMKSKPHARLNDAQKKIICTWVEEESERILGDRP